MPVVLPVMISESVVRDLRHGLRLLDARDPSTMVNLALKRVSSGAQWSFSYPDYEMLRDSLHSLSGSIAYRPAQLTISARALGRVRQRVRGVRE